MQLVLRPPKISLPLCLSLPSPFLPFLPLLSLSLLFSLILHSARHMCHNPSNLCVSVHFLYHFQSARLGAGSLREVGSYFTLRPWDVVSCQFQSQARRTVIRQEIQSDPIESASFFGLI